jgi:hypothetical protein
MVVTRRIRTDGFVDPRVPTLAAKPPTGPDWVHEIKHDGYRLIVRRDGKAVRLFTRRGYDWTDRYPARRHRRRAGFPTGRQGRPTSSTSPVAAECRLDRQGLCQAPGAGPKSFLGPQPPSRLPHLRGRPRGVLVQDDGRQPAQVGRHSARLRARRGRLQGSRWRGIVVIPK